MTNIKQLLFTCFVLGCISLQAQTQKGADFLGQKPREQLGFAISMADADNIIISSPYKSNQDNEIRGTTQVWQWDGTQWAPRGSQFKGINLGDKPGVTVFMPTVNTVGIGEAYFKDNPIGRFRVFDWNGEDWAQRGEEIGGIEGEVFSSISASMPDANTVAFAMNRTQENESEYYTRIVIWDGSQWVQKGSDIKCDLFESYPFANSVYMPDANTIAMKTRALLYPNTSGQISSIITVYQWNGVDWVKKGGIIKGESLSDELCSTISMPDANTLAIGSPYIYKDYSYTTGNVRVFNWDGSQWVQKGQNVACEPLKIEGEFTYTMPDVNTLVICSPAQTSEGKSVGILRTYSWDGSQWVQKGQDWMTSLAFGIFTSIYSPDPQTIAIGMPKYNESGLVRVYDLTALANKPEVLNTLNLQTYPNPASGELNLKWDLPYSETIVTVSNLSITKLALRSI